jgi:hypothetical protein
MMDGIHLLLAEPTLILTIGSTIASAAGAVMQGNQQSAALEAQKKAQDEAARTTEREGAANEAVVFNANRQRLGMQIAATGASGLTMSGSPLDFTLDDAINAEMEALNVRYQAATEARGLRAGAAMSGFEAKQARQAGYLGGAAALIAGGADVFKGVRQPNPASALASATRGGGKAAVIAGLQSASRRLPSV